MKKWNWRRVAALTAFPLYLSLGFVYLFSLQTFLYLLAFLAACAGLAITGFFFFTEMDKLG